MKPYVLIWGGGDLASGVAIRLHKVGIHLLIIETPKPLAVRRSVSFAQVVYDGSYEIEGVEGILINEIQEMPEIWRKNALPVLVDPDLTQLIDHKPLVLVDARMRKRFEPVPRDIAELVIGLGPGFVAGENCHAAIETNRGHFLGRVYWEGGPEADTGSPGSVGGYTRERVLHAPQSGIVKHHVRIGDIVKQGQSVLSVNGQEITAPFDGVVRGLIHEDLFVKMGMKVGDVDPRPEPFRCWFISEKSLAIGGGVLEAILTWKDIRSILWEA